MNETRYLRDHNDEIEKHAGYICVKCAGKHIANSRALEFDQLSPYMRGKRIFDELFACNTGYLYPKYTDILYMVSDVGTILCGDCARKAYICEHVDITSSLYEYGERIEHCERCNRAIVPTTVIDPDTGMPIPLPEDLDMFNYFVNWMCPHCNKEIHKDIPDYIMTCPHCDKRIEFNNVLLFDSDIKNEE